MIYHFFLICKWCWNQESCSKSTFSNSYSFMMERNISSNKHLALSQGSLRKHPALNSPGSMNHMVATNCWVLHAVLGKEYTVGSKHGFSTSYNGFVFGFVVYCISSTAIPCQYCYACYLLNSKQGACVKSLGQGCKTSWTCLGLIY